MLKGRYRKYESRFCVTCGSLFEVRKDSKTTHCSNKCANTKQNFRTCLYCGKDFKPRRKDSTYCSIECAGRAKRKRGTKLCEVCGKEVTRCDSQFKTHCFCSVECSSSWYSKNFKKENSSRWRGGKIEQNGYWFIKQDDGSYKQEHIIVAEQILGRPLECDEVVHHINRDKKDNRPDNLEVMTRAEHISIHRHDLIEAKG